MHCPAKAFSGAFHNTRSNDGVRAGSPDDVGDWRSRDRVVYFVKDEHSKRDEVHVFL